MNKFKLINIIKKIHGDSGYRFDEANRFYSRIVNEIGNEKFIGRTNDILIEMHKRRLHCVGFSKTRISSWFEDLFADPKDQRCWVDSNTNTCNLDRSSEHIEALRAEYGSLDNIGLSNGAGAPPPFQR